MSSKTQLQKAVASESLCWMRGVDPPDYGA
jgi:hypothetical protein